MSDLVQRIDNLPVRKRGIIHLVFWVVILLVYVVFFGRRNNNYLQTLFFVGLLMPVTIGTTYFFNYFLVPRYLLAGRFATFLLYSLYTLLFSLFAEVMVALITFVIMAGLRIQNMSPASVDIFFLLASLLMVVFLGVIIKMVLHWRTSREAYRQLLHEKMETELRLLKAQLNPHFLFNTLNNLYFLTTQKSEQAPAAVLQLSEILDYLLHSGKSIQVPLDDELRQAQNYIALEMLRYEGRADFSIQIEGDTGVHFIAPMTIVTLLENAFKHGVMPFASGAWIRLRVQAVSGSLSMLVSNGCRAASASPNGIGIKNLQSQLELVYGDKHKLSIQQGPSEFAVHLTINQ